MKSHEFYSQYANLPIGKRHAVIDEENHTMHDVYLGMKMADEEMMEWSNYQIMLLEIADKFFYEETRPKGSK